MVKKKSIGVSNLIVVSDIHAGCQMGLCAPGTARLDGGGMYQLSKFQEVLWGYWRHFWDEWVPRVTKDESFAVVINGDSLDGVHHDSTTQITHNLADQARIAEAILRPLVERSNGRFWMTRGTEAHVGKSGQEEERLARGLNAVEDKETRNSARFALRLRVKDCLCHIQHHIGTTGSAAHEASAVNAELTAEYVEAARWRDEPPDFIIRSHRHRAIVVDIDTSKGYGAGIVTPGWQGKTPFAYRVAGARISQPMFGGFLVRQGDEEFYYRRMVYRIAPPKEELV